MASATDKQRVNEYINPFMQPQPSDETGPGTHFGSVQNMPAININPVHQDSKAPPAYNAIQNPYTAIPEQPTGTSTTSTNTNPFRRTSLSTAKGPSVSVHSHARKPSNGTSPSRTERFPSISTHNYRSDAFGDAAPRTLSPDSSPRSGEIKTRPRRVSSLNERFPGDPSVRPLDMIRHDAKVADRAPHLRKQHIPGADTVDRLDAAAVRRYHHEGPYDAALLARNTSYNSSPVAALENTNREALRATPRENIRDSIDKHRPLDGVARVPSGEIDTTTGRRLDYTEGPDLQREEGGDMGRWPGVDYHPDDVKGKGEPAFSVERRIKESHGGKDKLPDDTYIELVERPRKSLDSRGGSRTASPGAVGTAGVAEGSSSAHAERYSDWETGRRVSRSGSKRLSVDLKRRIGSLRRKDRGGEEGVDA